MKKFLVLFPALALLLANFPSTARAQEDEYGSGGQYAREDEDDAAGDGWFLGSDQGVLFFVGDGADFFNLQYYSTIFGGYNIRGIFQPMLRLGQAIGSAEGFFNPGTFFFFLEGGFRVTPIRYKFRPFLVSTVGMYVLDFDDFGFPVRGGVNFTYTAGGGLEYSFGSNTIFLGGEFRGFVNEGPNFNGVTVTIGYAFQF